MWEQSADEPGETGRAGELVPEGVNPAAGQALALPDLMLAVLALEGLTPGGTGNREDEATD
jgi:hypothetical protein